MELIRRFREPMDIEHSGKAPIWVNTPGKHRFQDPFPTKPIVSHSKPPLPHTHNTANAPHRLVARRPKKKFPQNKHINKEV